MLPPGRSIYASCVKRPGARRRLLSVGIDPRTSIVFAQSHVAQHAELAWILSCLTSFGELWLACRLILELGHALFTPISAFMQFAREALAPYM